MSFLGSLIETAEDVKELRATGMLHNYYGNDEEVANLIRRMSRDLVCEGLIGGYWSVQLRVDRHSANLLFSVCADFLK